MHTLCQHFSSTLLARRALLNVQQKHGVDAAVSHSIRRWMSARPADSTSTPTGMYSLVSRIALSRDNSLFSIRNADLLLVDDS